MNIYGKLQSFKRMELSRTRYPVSVIINEHPGFGSSTPLLASSNPTLAYFEANPRYYKF